MLKVNLKQRRAFLTAIIVGLYWSAAFAITSFAQQPISQTASVSVVEIQNLKVFDRVWELINKRYYDSSFNGRDWQKSRAEFRSKAAAAVDERELYATLNQMLQGLRDKHAFAVAPSAVKREKARKNDHIVDGIGLTGRFIEENFVITEVKVGSPAESAGIQTGWILTEWNGESFDYKLFPSGRYRTTLGEKVRFKFLDEKDQSKDISVVAGKYPFVVRREAKILKDGVFYVRFDEFISGTSDWFVGQIEKNRNAELLIVDLRNNTGGLLWVLENCLEVLFKKDQNIGSQIKRESDGKNWKIRGKGDNAFRGKVFVLTDQTTASAAEIFAAAIQETKRGFVIGRKTAGAVLVVIREDLPGGGELSLSVRDYRTPSGFRPEGKGISPDLAVPTTLSDFRRKFDSDLSRLFEIRQ